VLKSENFLRSEVVNLEHLWKAGRTVVFVVDQIVTAEDRCASRALRQT